MLVIVALTAPLCIRRLQCRVLIPSGASGLANSFLAGDLYLPEGRGPDGRGG